MTFTVSIGAGKSTSWGFAIDFDPIFHGLSITFIHWFFYIEVWQEK